MRRSWTRCSRVACGASAQLTPLPARLPLERTLLPASAHGALAGFVERLPRYAPATRPNAIATAANGWFKPLWDPALFAPFEAAELVGVPQRVADSLMAP